MLEECVGVGGDGGGGGRQMKRLDVAESEALLQGLDGVCVCVCVCVHIYT